MSKRDTRLLLEDLLQSAKKIKRYTEGLNFNEFLSDDKTIDAVVRNFEIIGEVVNRIPEEYKNQNPEIEWNRIRGFRNRLVHEYFGVDFEIVWIIIQEYLDEIINWVEPLINPKK